jgi:hypothetical protein
MSDFTPRTTPNFMAGMFLTANGISDSLLLYRGSRCIEEQLRQAFHPHSLGHPLTLTDDGALLALTMDPLSMAVMGTEDRVAVVAAQAMRERRIGVVLLAQLPYFNLIGETTAFQSEILGRKLSVPVMATDTQSMVRDYLDAANAVLTQLGSHIAQSPPVARTPRSVALAGYLWPRAQGDAEGDLLEFGRLVQGAGGSPSVVMLSGRPYKEYFGILEADVLLETDLGREAAALIADTSGATRLPLELPVSLEDTCHWVRTVAHCLDCPGQAEDFIDKELRRVLPRLDKVVLPHLAGKRAVVMVTPDRLPGICRCLTDDLGITVAASICRTRVSGSDAENPDDVEALHRTCDPSAASIRYHLEEASRHGSVDLIMGSHWEWSVLPDRFRNVPFVEFGFPQYKTHFLTPTPHIGFNGVLTWAERILGALMGGRADS